MSYLYLRSIILTSINYRFIRVDIITTLTYENFSIIFGIVNTVICDIRYNIRLSLSYCTESYEKSKNFLKSKLDLKGTNQNFILRLITTFPNPFLKSLPILDPFSSSLMKIDQLSVELIECVPT